MTYAERILETLDTHGAMLVGELAEILDASTNAVSPVLTTLKVKGKVERMDNGKWCCAEERDEPPAPAQKPAASVESPPQKPAPSMADLAAKMASENEDEAEHRGERVAAAMRCEAREQALEMKQPPPTLTILDQFSLTVVTKMGRITIEGEGKPTLVTISAVVNILLAELANAECGQ